MASRKPRGDAVTVAPTGRGFHPHGYQIVKVLALAANPSIDDEFLANESHLYWYVA